MRRITATVLLVLAGVSVFSPYAGAPQVVGQSVLQVTGGTINVGAPQVPLGTLVLYMWRVESEQADGFLFTLRGPAGWNSDAPLSWRDSRKGTGVMLGKAIRTTAAIAGEYTLTTAVAGNEASAKFQIDLSAALTRPVVRATSSRGVVTASWTAIPNALTYEVYLQPLQRTDLVLPMGLRPASETSAIMIIGGLPAGRYQAMVVAYTFNLMQSPSASTTLPEQVQASIGAGEFNFP